MSALRAAASFSVTVSTAGVGYGRCVPPLLGYLHARISSAAKTSAVAAMISPYLTRGWKFVPWVLASIVLVARTYVGAHSPLDVIGGAGLGLAIGSVLKFAFALGPTDRPAGRAAAAR